MLKEPYLLTDVEFKLYLCQFQQAFCENGCSALPMTNVKCMAIFDIYTWIRTDICHHVSNSGIGAVHIALKIPTTPDLSSDRFL